MTVINDYIEQTRRIIGDVARRNITDDAEIVDYINQARELVSEKALCCRRVLSSTTTPSIVMTASQETIDLDESIICTLTISVEWSSTYRIPIEREEWGDFDKKYRVLPTYKQVPTNYAELDRKIWLFPIPDIVYPLIVQCAMYPQQSFVVGSSLDDDIPRTYRRAIPFYAAFYACIRLNADTRAERLRELGDSFLLSSAKARRPFVISRVQ